MLNAQRHRKASHGLGNKVPNDFCGGCVMMKEVFQTTICDYGQMFCIFRSPNTNKNLKTRKIIDEEYGLEIEINTRGRGKLVKAGLKHSSDECIVPSYVKTIGSMAFDGVCDYTKVILPPGVTTIEECAFKDSCIKQLVIPLTVSKIGDGALAFSDWTKVEIDPDNPYYSTDGKALYSKDYSSLLYLFNSGDSYDVDYRTRKVCSNAFGNSSVREINFHSPSISFEKDAFSNSHSFDGEENLETIRFYGQIDSMESQSLFEEEYEFLEVYLDAITREEWDKKGLSDVFPEGAIIHFKDGTSFSKTYSGGVRYDFDYERNEATACCLQLYYDNPYIAILPEVNGMPVTRIEKYFTSLDGRDKKRSCRNHERIIFVPHSIETIDDKAFADTSFSRCTIAAFDFTSDEWNERFGSLIWDDHINFICSDEAEENDSCASSEYYQAERFLYHEGCLFYKDESNSESVTRLVFYPWYREQNAFEIPEGVEIIDDFAFYSNDYLESLMLPRSLFTIPYFHGIRNLKEFKVHEDNPYYSTIDGVLFNKDGSALLAYPRGKEGIEYRVPDSVKMIRRDAFANDVLIERMTIPSSIESFPFDLWSLDNVKDVTILKGNLEWTTVDGILFNRDCTTLMRYPKNKQDSCYMIPDTVLKIKDDAFEGCSRLINITYNQSNKEE